MRVLKGKGEGGGDGDGGRGGGAGVERDILHAWGMCVFSPGYDFMQGFTCLSPKFPFLLPSFSLFILVFLFYMKSFHVSDIRLILQLSG